MYHDSDAEGLVGHVVEFNVQIKRPFSIDFDDDSDRPDQD